MTSPQDPPPSWDGIPPLVPLHQGVSVGTWLVTIFLTVISLGLLLPFLVWDFLRRANGIGRDGIHTHVGVLPWTELRDASVHTSHTSRRQKITATVSMVRLVFAQRTIDVGPWGAPEPQLAIRALSAGVGRTLPVPRPTGNVQFVNEP